MKRLTLIPALILASPAWAHPASGPHVHGAENLPLIMGLVLIASAAGVVAVSRVQARASR